MARINTNIPAMVAQSRLTRSTDDLTTRLMRLSTGLRINRGADDPAGLIVSERLRSEMQGITQAVDNSERASAVIATTEANLAEIANLLTSMKALVVEAANSGGVSSEEIEANQLQIDSAIDSITRISNTASFAGLQLLNGSMAFLTSGVPTSAIESANVIGAQFGTNTTIPVQVEVLASAQTASLFLSGNGPPAGALQSGLSIEIAGNAGVQTLSFVSGTSLTDVATAVNRVSSTTGVTATLAVSGMPASGLVFNSVGYGSDEFVSVRQVGLGGNFFETYDTEGGILVERDEGRDVLAVVNGSAATGDGLKMRFSTPALSIEFELSVAYAQTTGSIRSFDITGGGATFQLGPKITSSQQVGYGIQSVAASRVGGTTLSGVRYFLDSIRTGGDNSLLTERVEQASAILESAITDVSVLRGRLGAFERNTLQTNVRSLQVGLENIAAAESQIRDADFAVETSALVRAQILNQAGTSVLATANSLSQNVLSLLA